MTDARNKRKWAGEPIADKRKVVPEPPKHGHKPKPKVYLLKVVETTTTEYEYTLRYPTRKARDQAKADAQKKAEAHNVGRRSFSFYRKAHRTVDFEESEE